MTCIYSEKLDIQKLERAVYTHDEVQDAYEDMAKTVKRTMPSWPTCNGVPVELDYKTSREPSGMLRVTLFWFCRPCATKIAEGGMHGW
jgi:hypothetical protein